MKHVIVTGASSGLGHAIAEHYASIGCRVGIAARRSAPLQALQAKYPQNIEWSVIDITLPDAQEKLTDLIERTGGMDLFIQAAGIGKQNPGLDNDIERSTLMTNCVGFTAMVDTAFNYFKNHPKPDNRIAAITSVAGTKGLGMAASYSASKRFESTYLTALEQLAHIEGIKIAFTDIRPGFIATDLLNKENHYPMLMSPDHAVPLIIKAIERKKRIAVIDCRWWWLVQAWRMIPRRLWVKIRATTHKLDSHN